MKSWKIFVTAGVLGIVVGVGITVVEMYGANEIFYTADYAKRQVAAKAPANLPAVGELVPKAEVIGGRIYEFGSMERLSKMRHTFRIKNVGTAGLKLTVRRTTCKCTVGQIEGNICQPGETAELDVEWTGNTPGSSSEFEQTVEVETNDPTAKLLSLRIKGLVTETLRAFPQDLSLGRVSSNEGAKGEFRLFGFRSDTLEILDSMFEDSTTADHFEISFEPLSAEEVAKEKGASCGVLAKVVAKPGLPIGPINQTIRIRAEAEKEAEVHIPVKGWVLGDVIVTGLQFQRAKNLLTFGALKRSESAKAVLNVFVTGPYHKETHITVGEVDPKDYLHVDISPPEELSSGNSVKYVVTVEIPAGLEPVNRFGSWQAGFGHIVLETTHPQMKRIPIDVKFSIE